MLIDSTHKKWIGGAAALAVGAVALHAALSWSTPGGLTGGSTIGLWYGVAASALMVFAGMLSALRMVPSWWWIGSRQSWLRGHIWLGLLSGVLVLCHSGYRWGGLLEKMLWIVFGAILLTGIYGLALQQFLPRLLAWRIPCEAPYEQIPHLCGVLRSQADELVEALSLWPLQEVSEGGAGESGGNVLRPFHEQVLRPFLEDAPNDSPLASAPQADAVFARIRSQMGLNAVNDHKSEAEKLMDAIRTSLDTLPDKKDLLVKTEAAFKKLRDSLMVSPDVVGLATTAKRVFAELPAFPEQAGVSGRVLDLKRLCQDRWLAELEALCLERRHYAEQERIHHWLHGWLLLHIPLSVALLVLGTLHAVVSLYY